MSPTINFILESDRDITAAKQAAHGGPVFIAEKEHASCVYVLLTLEQYRKLGGEEPGIADLLSTPEVAEIDFEPERIEIAPRKTGL